MREPDYQRGNVRLYCGDCREILPELEGIDAVLTDPPYGLGDKWNGGAGGAKSSWRIPQGEAKKWDMQTARGVEELPQLGECVIWGGNYYSLAPSRCWLVWDKCQPDTWTTGQCELAWTNINKPIRAFRMCQAVAHTEIGTKHHSAQKPVSLMQWCLKWIAGNSILDPYMGSGTTGVACVKERRGFVGIEIDPAYFQVAVARIDRVLDQGVLF